MKKIVKLTIIILIAAGIGFFAIKKYEKMKKPVYVMQEVPIEYGDIKLSISATGVVEPQNRLEIKPTVNGRIEKVLVNEGDKVREGQIIAVMSSTDRAALLDAAKEKGAKEQEYWENVYKSTPLIAPIDGEVIVRAVEPGQTVTTSSVILVLSDRLIVKAQVDETDIGRVNAGQKVVLSLDAYPEIKVSAFVDHISYESTIINNVTIYVVDIVPYEVPKIFRSGMSANVEIMEKISEHVLIAPKEAVAYENKKAYVLIKSEMNGGEEKREVTTGVSDDKNVEIVSGLSEKDKVLISSKNYSLPQAGSEGKNPFMPSFRGRH